MSETNYIETARAILLKLAREGAISKYDAVRAEAEIAAALTQAFDEGHKAGVDDMTSM